MDAIAELQALMAASLRRFQVTGKRRRRKVLKVTYYNLGVASGIARALTALGHGDRVTATFDAMKAQDPGIDEAFVMGLMAGHFWGSAR